MAATEKEGSALGPLLQAALALPILVVPVRAGAAEVGEMGFTLLGYKERGLMKVTEPILWGHARIGEDWEIAASAAVDIITGASPQVVTNIGGKPVQTISGASISERRLTSDVKVGRHFGDFTLSASHTSSREHDYLSTASGVEGRLDLNDRLTTITAGYGRSDDRVRSHDDPTLDQPRTTNEYLIGISQVLSPVAVVQSTLTTARGHGWYNDPYKFTLTFYPEGGAPAFLPDLRPSQRNTWAWTTRYRHHFPATHMTLQAEYRYYHDDWGIDAHTLEVALHHALTERFALRPALRYYTQSAADFYSPTIPKPAPAVLSSDQRLGAFGGLSPSLRATVRLDNGFRIEGTAGYVHNARTLHFGGSGSEAFATLRAVYGILGVSREF
ncbi:MAG: DUF3570 domain-containing protein [Betaproteobacteria bacterium]